MLPFERIHQAYNDVTQTTLARWERSDGCGSVRDEPFYHPTKLAFSSGNRAELRPDVLRLLSAMQEVTQDDPLADLNTASGVHFSFFPITNALYTRLEQSEEREAFTAIFSRCCAGHIMHISQLRLVALPNQILLAGIPDARSLDVRKLFAEALLDSKWQDKVRARYPSGDIPQLFWHSTLLRYNAECVSPKLQALFLHFQNHDFGAISLPVRLVMCNYNWQQVEFLV
ncbi:hypothetical protein [Hafnia psychrotolerans]|uniref:Uncharacterized protein n=1 Tax=Hafnia psychrotolerans TaxID=1477018 RepID=A0ABQ1GRP7_9GAMM|nr:hypothetical protein [Hafnia psychrotolerans]GGA48635.1 hypothetical protein GCM10011328_24830 [Hafnia psychrotolerans]